MPNGNSSSLNDILQQHAESAGPGDLESALKKHAPQEGFFEKVGRWGDTLTALNPMSGQFNPEVARQVGAGAVQELTGAAEGLMSLPSAISHAFGGAGVTPLDTATEFLHRFDQGIITHEEAHALDAGLTPEEIGAARGLGHFVGFTVPLAVSLGAGEAITGVAGFAEEGIVKSLASGRLPMKVATRRLLAGNVLTDFTAGLIYGGTMTEGDLRQRAGTALKEGTTFGLARLVIGGLTAPFAAWRLNSMADKAVGDQLQRTIESVMNGAPISTPEEAQTVMRQLTQENYILNSPRAQDILRDRVDQTATVQAILDVNANKATSGLVRGIREPSPWVDRLNQSFPNLNFRTIKRGEGNWDVWFGAQDLTNDRVKQLRVEGRYAGQSVMKDGTEFSYVGKSPTEGRVFLQRLDSGTKISVNAEKVSDMPYGAPPALRKLFDVKGALYDDFRDWFMEKSYDASTARGQMSEVDFVNGIKSGAVQLDDLARRNFNVEGALTQPEDAGVEATTVFHIDAGSTAETTKRAGISELQPSGNWLSTVVPRDPETGQLMMDKPLARQSVKNYADSRDFMHSLGMTDEATSLVAKTGNQHVMPLEPVQNLSFSDLVQLWTKDRKLPQEAADAPVMQQHFAAKLTQELWGMVPPEERNLLEGLRAEYEKLTDASSQTLEHQAALKGFQIEASPDGRYFMRNVNSGVQTELADRATAEEALRNIQHPGDDLAPQIVPPQLGGGVIETGVQGATDGELHFPEDLHTQALLDSLPSSNLHTTRTFFQSVEELTGIPLWSRFFEHIDRGTSQMRADYGPWARQIMQSWKGMSRAEREGVGEFWKMTEGKGMSEADLGRVKDRMLTPRQQLAEAQARRIWDAGAQVAGAGNERYIEHYFGRIKPWADAHGGRVDPEGIFPEGLPGGIDSMFQRTRAGDLSVTESDPAMVMHKWFRSMFFERHVKAPWEDAARLVGFGGQGPMLIKDLPSDLSAKMIEGGDGRIGMNDPVLPDPIRKTLGEYLNAVRGRSEIGLQGAQKLMRRFMEKLDIQGDPRIVDEYMNAMVSTMYGSAMALRPMLISRNFIQNVWMQGTKFGFEHAGSSLERAFTFEGFSEAQAAGAIRNTEAGVPLGDLIFEHMIDRGAPQSDALVGGAVASAMRAGLKLGSVSRSVTEKMMIPYSGSDEISRSWGYWWQKMHTEKWVDLWEKGKISQDKFLEEGIPFMGQPVREEFLNRYNRFGREDALRFMGKVGADESNFIYGVGAQPAWMQRPAGRLFGMFGTWPLWGIENYTRVAKYGTGVQQAKFLLRNSALATVLATMSVQSGINLWNYIAPTGFTQWAGGPATQWLIDAHDLITAPMDQKKSAAKRMAQDGLRMSYPGQSFMRDIDAAASASDDPRALALSMMVGRPNPAGHFALQYLYNPLQTTNPIPLDPERRQIENSYPNRPALNLKGLLPAEATGASSSSRGGGLDVGALLAGNK